MVIEVVLSLLHPSLLFDGIKLGFNREWFNVKVTYEINDFLVLSTLIKIYSIWSMLIHNTIYKGPRAFKVRSPYK